MQLCRIVVFAFYSLLWFIQETGGQGDFCSPRIPVVNICTDQTIAMSHSVYISTVSVPKFRQTFCKCTIAPFQYGTTYSFVIYGYAYPKGMQFEINEQVLGETDIRGRTYLVEDTPICLSTPEYNGLGGICVNVYTENRSNFSISCTESSESKCEQRKASTTKYTDTSISTSSGLFTTVSTRRSSGNVTESKLHIRQDQGTGQVHIIIIVLPTMIGASLIVAAAVILLKYVKRRRLAEETKLQGNEHHRSVPTQSQSQQNNASTEECEHSISVNQYERLNVYVNDNLAGEMYQQLEADKNEEYQEMHDVKNTSRNQDRGQTRSITGHGEEQGNVSRCKERKPETPPNTYERLNMYENDKLREEMYQQLNADQPSFSAVKNGFGKTDKPNTPTTAVYANEIPRDDAYDDLA